MIDTASPILSAAPQASRDGLPLGTFAAREYTLFEAVSRVHCVQALCPSLSATAYAKVHQAHLLDRLKSHRAVLFRGFDVPDANAFEELVEVFHREMLDYRYGSSPRTRMKGNIFTSTEFPSAEVIPLHNEMSYTTEWPRKIWFYSELCAETGGQTPLADSHRVHERIPTEVRERFNAHGVRYVRNYAGTFDLSWQKTFQTESREAVERYCASRSIQCEWISPDHLRTTETCQATLRHPDDGRWLWLNQAHLFHTSAMKPDVREVLEDSFAPEDLPRQAWFGDGSPISDDDLEAVRRAYDAETLSFPWQRGDVLLVDNLAMAHGRNRFTGSRRVLVAMGEAFDGLTSR
jgi:alpha-ketoglutarate-dependent taurine dioxygenase